MSTRTPKAVVAEARSLYSEGLSPMAIAFKLNITDPDKVRRWCDPVFAKAEKVKHIIRRRSHTR